MLSRRTLDPVPARFRPFRRAWAGTALLAASVLPSAAQGLPEKPTLAILGLQGAFTMPQRQSPPAPPSGAAGRRYPGAYARQGAQGQQAAQPRTRPLGELLVQRIDMAYLKTGQFRLVERTQMGAVLKEGVFEQKGAVDDATAVTLGRQVGAKFVLVGSYSGSMARAAEVQEHLFSKDTRTEFYPCKLEVRLRMVGTESGVIQEPMIIIAEAKDAQPTKAFEMLMDEFGRQLERELAVRYPMTGYVVKSLSDKEYLSDLGRSRGVVPGDTFLALEVGPDVVHPVTGKVIPGERRVVGELMVTDAGQESSTLRLTSGRGALKPGTLLERKPK